MLIPLFCMLGLTVGAGQRLRAETVERSPLQSRLAGASLAWTSADFDGDHHADWVGARQSAQTDDYDLVFFSGEHADWPQMARPHWTNPRLQASDIDGDHDADLVLENSSAQPVAVWLNDGKGHFERGDLNDYPALLASRDPKAITGALFGAADEQTSEEAGLNVLAPAARDFAPILARSSFTPFPQAADKAPHSTGPGARGPPTCS